MPRRSDRTAPAQTAAALELEERFAREYLVDTNAAAAYRRCRPDVTDATAKVQGCQMLARPSVAARVATLKAELFARLEIQAADVLRELAIVGFSDVRHYQVNRDTGALELAADVLEERARAVASVKTRTVHSGEGESARVEYHTELRLWDKLGALVKLGEHFKLFKQDDSARGRTEVVVDPDGSVHIITGAPA
jgi:phage terminase small subunit